MAANRYIINHKNSDVVLGPSGKIIQDKPIAKGRENLFLGTVTKDGPLTYIDSTGKIKEFIEMGQNMSRLATERELQLDAWSYTNPNLHRRIDVKLSEDTRELAYRKYRLEISKYNSYRNVQVVTHLDYTDLDKYENDPNYDKIKIRFADYEKKEIP